MAEDGVDLQLGDIVRVVAPGHGRIPDDPMIVKELGEEWIRLAGRDGVIADLPLSSTGVIDDERVTSIELLSRAPTGEQGYARQNGLVPGNWVDLHFGGDEPLIVTGKIVDLDEDQIEVQPLAAGEPPLFIDFGYRGIPEDLPLDRIDLRSPPQSAQEQRELPVPGEEAPSSDQGPAASSDEEDDGEFGDVGKGADVPDLRATALAPGDIQIGPDLEAVTQIVDVPEVERRFGLGQQTNDLLDDMLAALPTAARTEEAVNAVHRLIERFRELREEYSVFESPGIVTGALERGADHKPVAEVLQELRTPVHWALPIARNRKKIYDLDAEEAGEYGDVLAVTQAATRSDESRIIEAYREDSILAGGNRYDTMLRDLTPLLCPWTSPLPGDTPPLFAGHVSGQITSVVDNLGDMRSSAVRDGQLGQKRFFIQPHSAGLDSLGVIRHAGGEITYAQTQITPGDPITVTGLLTLPSDAIAASRAGLPAADLATRVDLATALGRITDELGESAQLGSASAPPGVSTSRLLDTPVEHLRGSVVNTWKELVEAAVPTTASIAAPWLALSPEPLLSVHAAIRWLEPFRVYAWNLHSGAYTTILEHVVGAQKAHADASRAAFSRLAQVAAGSQAAGLPPPPLLDALSTSPAEQAEVIRGYGLTPDQDDIIMRSRQVDGGRLLMSALGKLSVGLMQGNAEAEAEKIAAAAARKSEAAASSPAGRKCAEPVPVLAKVYLAQDELEEDNGRRIVFDRNLDPTYYDVIDDYREAMAGSSSTEEQATRLAAALAEKTGMRGALAEREAAALLAGERAVVEGDHAALQPEGSDSPATYFVRTGERWVPAPDLTAADFEEPSKVRCDIRPECVAVNDKCMSQEGARAAMIEKDWAEMEQEFDRAVELNTRARRKLIENAFLNAARRAPLLRALELSKHLKVQRARHALGTLSADEAARRSPHARLRDMILAQADLAKRQANIGRFVDRFTRPAQTTGNEDKWWLYCVDTGLKLLPVFLATLARAFLDGRDYLETARTICAQQGTISDDGNAWVDRYSGYAIVPIDYDDDEGYTESGFRVQTRAVMEQDMGLSSEPVGADRFKDPSAKAIAQAALGLAGFVGVDVEPSIEFIVRQSSELVSAALPARAAYEAMAEKKAKRGKKGIDTYEAYAAKTRVLVTSAVTLLGIQTQVPPAVPDKRFPGCVATLAGYPMGAVGELGAVKYIACVMRKISRSSVPPWSAIRGLKTDSIRDKLEAILARQVMGLQAVKRRVRARLEYERLNPPTEGGVDPALQSWINFLPPLAPVRIRAPAGLTDAVRRTIIGHLRSGSAAQDKDILSLQGRAMMLSLKVFELIEATVAAKSLSLATASGDPYLENSCCDDPPRNPLSYFEKSQSAITEKNREAGKVRDFLDDLGTMARAPMLFDPADTRRVFPPPASTFSEETIYRAFIVFCKYDYDTAPPPRLERVCTKKPDAYDPLASIAAKISALKSSGLARNERSLQQLMQVVDEENLVKLDLGTIALSTGQNLLATARDPDLEIPPGLADKLESALSARGSSDDGPPKVRAFREWLGTRAEDMLSTIDQFLAGAGTAGPRARRAVETARKCVVDLTRARPSGHGADPLRSIKDYTHQLARVLPNIIVKGVNYASVAIPAHWKLSQAHEQQVKAFIERYYQPLVPFYGSAALRPLLTRYTQQVLGVYTLLERLYPEGADTPLDERTTGLFAAYLFLSTLSEYVWLATRDPGVASAAEDAETSVGGVGGAAESLAVMAADLLVAMLGIVDNQRRLTEMPYDELMRIAHRTGEHEKDLHVAALGALTDEERDVVMQLRRADVRPAGTGGGYTAANYDQEIAQMETQALAEMRVGEQHMVTAMNRDIYAMDAIAEQAEADRIEAEAASLAHLGDDDDFGDRDGDEGF